MLEMDLTDKRILYELDLDSRQTNKQIAKKIRVSEQVVGKRIKRLIEKNAIDYFYVKLNPSRLGFIHIKIYLRFHNLPQDREDALVQELNMQKAVFWLASIRGKFDLEVSIYVRNISEFSAKYDGLFGSWHEYIYERNVSVLENAYSYAKTYLLPDTTPRKTGYIIPASEPHETSYAADKGNIFDLDSLDISILRVLNKEARLPFSDIAFRVGVSSDTIHYRIKRLADAGVISGFGVKINYGVLGNSYHILMLKLQNMDASKYKKLQAFCHFNPNSIIYIKTIGDHEAEFEIETQHKSELDTLIRSLKDNFLMEIKDYELLEVTREHRMTYFPF